MAENDPEFSAVLEVLTRNRVEFIVVGGICAVLLGAPITTFDVDIVHSRTEENLSRLTKALEELEAHYRDQLPRKRMPSREALSKTGHHLLATRFGPLDVLGSIGIRDGYAELRSHTETVEVGDGIEVRILDLATLIEVKQKTARSKDNYMLEILREMHTPGKA